MNVVQGSGPLHLVLLKFEEFNQIRSVNDIASLLACGLRQVDMEAISLNGPHPRVPSEISILVDGCVIMIVHVT